MENHQGVDHARQDQARWPVAGGRRLGAQGDAGHSRLLAARARLVPLWAAAFLGLEWLEVALGTLELAHL